MAWDTVAMKLSLYVPKKLEKRLLDEAVEVGVTPSRLIQGWVEDRLTKRPRRFPQEFLELAGTWEDDRTTAEIVRDIKAHSAEVSRAGLR